MASSSEKKTLTLRSSDGEIFEVEEHVALQSEAIKHIIEDGCADGPVPLPNVTGKTLARVIEYCNKHAESAAAAANDGQTASKYVLRQWDNEFVNVDADSLFDLILAANYLSIKGLLDLTCQTMADVLKNKSPEDVREMFNIENDFTPEEEEEVRREHQWAFDEA